MHIYGDGIAACCALYLISGSDVRVPLSSRSRFPVPAILLNDAAQDLIRDVFNVPHLFQVAHRVTRRIVAWGHNAEPVELPHSGIVVSERELLAALPETVASSVAPHKTGRLDFGTRFATSAKVTVEDGQTCYIESHSNGWLFLVPDTPRSGWLLSVGDELEVALGASRLIAKKISFIQPGGRFPAFPSLADPLSAPGWITCGGAAMTFDPICGDGTANAVREGVLAAAVILHRGDTKSARRHYNARLIAGFDRHLKLCRQFYMSGDNTPWWKNELAQLDRGIAFCKEALANHGDFRYRLNGLELEEL